ncbi:MAG: caspase family protein, partial [Rhodocyclaceae bacterium]
APGNVAEDGTGRNSPYSRYLAETMRVAGLRIEDVLKRVRTRVREETNGRQVTWDNSSIEGDFYFLPPAGQAVASAPAEGPGKPLVTPRPRVEPAAVPRPALPERPISAAPPAPAGGSLTSLPAPGDTWTYRLRSRWANVGERIVVARVLDSAPGEIRDSLSLENAASKGEERKFDGRVIVAERQAGGVTISELNPYLAAFARMTPGERWQPVAIPDLPGSATPWNAQARIVDKERVKTPAGEFDALRIQLDAHRTVIGGSLPLTTEPARIDQILWYAPEVKRLVRYQRKVFTTNGRVLDEDTLELIRFELR